MKTITLELPDEMADAFESLSPAVKKRAALFSIVVSQDTLPSLETLFSKIDNKIASTGITEQEIETLLNELS